MVLDVERLQGLLDEYRRMQQGLDLTRQARGQRFNGLIAEMLQCWGIEAIESIRSAGEIDVGFTVGGHRYIVEAKWENDRSNTGQIAKLQKRLRQRIAGTYGIFLSVAGYSREALNDLAHGERLEVLLLDATHLEEMLTGRMSPHELLSQLHNRAAWYGEAYVPVPKLTASADTPAAPASAPEPAQPIVSVPIEDGWEPFRPERGNPHGQYVAFESRTTFYWIMATIYSLFALTFALLLLIPEIPLLVKAGLGLAELWIVFVAIATAKTASAPTRLEVGAEGIQVFTRKETTWFPWHKLERVEVTRLEGGAMFIVAWCSAANRFPEFTGFGRGPRYVRRLGAVAICQLNILRTRRHLVIRALHTYGGNRVGRL